MAHHNRSFVDWFRDRITRQVDVEPSHTLLCLARGPQLDVVSYRAYDINGFSFYTKMQDDRSIMQNSGVTVDAQALHVSSSKDKRPIVAQMAYYGVIEDIWELDYIDFREPVFRCKWVDNNNGVQVDDFGFTMMDLGREGHKGDQFIMASQARQVFYIQDPSNEKWSIVLQGKRHSVGEDGEDISEYIDETPPFSLGLPVESEDTNLDEVYVRVDHEEGIYIEDRTKRRNLKKRVSNYKKKCILYGSLYI